MKRILAIIFFLCVVASPASGGQIFRYRFAAAETLRYRFTLDSQLKLLEYQNLARMFNIDKLRHNVQIDLELIPMGNESGKVSVTATIDRVSSVLIAGDSVYVNDGSTWGELQPGSRYHFKITPRGEISDFQGPDTAMSEQEIQLIQQFFPVFPDKGITEEASWSDSSSLIFVKPDGQPVQLGAYRYDRYIGAEAKSKADIHDFKFRINGIADDSTITLGGEGDFVFDNGRGRLIETSAFLNTETAIDPAAFGLPSGLGSGVPVEIKSNLTVMIR
jgi:hypothetical protein